MSSGVWFICFFRKEPKYKNKKSPVYEPKDSPRRRSQNLLTPSGTSRLKTQGSPRLRSRELLHRVPKIDLGRTYRTSLRPSKSMTGRSLLPQFTEKTVDSTRSLPAQVQGEPSPPRSGQDPERTSESGPTEVASSRPCGNRSLLQNDRREWTETQGSGGRYRDRDGDPGSEPSLGELVGGPRGSLRL